MACRFHSQRRPVPLLPGHSVRPPAESAAKQSPAWFEIPSLRGLGPAGGARNPGTTPPADTAAKRLANSHSTCSPTNLLPPDSYPACRFDRSTAERLLPNACPAWENPCHPQSTPLPDRVSAWLAALPDAPAPASPRHSCALRATTIPCSSSSTVCSGRRAPRRWPDPPYMPRSASVGGLAKRGVIPQNNSTSNCSFLT